MREKPNSLSTNLSLTTPNHTTSLHHTTQNQHHTIQHQHHTTQNQHPFTKNQKRTILKLQIINPKDAR